MATAVDIYSKKQSYYVPEFQVSIAGKKVEEGILRDVMQVTYKDNVEEIDSFELMVNNWDAAKFLPKYEPPSDNAYAGIFDPGKRLELRMGYRSHLMLMLTGEITTLEPSFPEAGSPTLSVRGLNVLHSLRTEQHSYAWEKMRDSDIAVQLGKMPVKAGKPGLGLEVKTDPAKQETAEAFVMMNNQFDIVFLMERARRHGYEVVLNEKDATQDRHLYFGPSKSRLEAPIYKLEWGKSLSSFKPKLSTARQISAVNVRGWDRSANKPIDETVGWKDLVPAGPEQKRLELIAQAFDNRKEIVTDEPVRNAAEARQKAEGKLRKQLTEMVTATGVTVGLPDLRAGSKVQILGLGPRYSGTYYVTQTTHTMGDGGYRTQFEGRRDPIDQQGTTGGQA
jgi:phage protein D